MELGVLPGDIIYARITRGHGSHDSTRRIICRLSQSKLGVDFFSGPISALIMSAEIGPEKKSFLRAARV